MAKSITSSDTDLTIAPTTKCALCVDGFFSERDSGVRHLAACHSVDAAVLESAAKLLLSQVQERNANNRNLLVHIKMSLITCQKDAVLLKERCIVPLPKDVYFNFTLMF